MREKEGMQRGDDAEPPSFINASMRQSYQRIRDSHWESAVSGLGEHMFHEVLQVYRSVAKHGDAALDGVNLPLHDVELCESPVARKGSKRGKSSKNSKGRSGTQRNSRYESCKL